MERGEQTFNFSLFFDSPLLSMLVGEPRWRRGGEIEILLGVCRIKQQSVTIIAEQPFEAMPPNTGLR